MPTDFYIVSLCFREFAHMGGLSNDGVKLLIYFLTTKKILSKKSSKLLRK